MFTTEEQKRFQTRLDNGYDLKNDPRYNFWLSMQDVNNDTDDTDHVTSNLVTTETCNEKKKCKMYTMCIYMLEIRI